MLRVINLVDSRRQINFGIWNAAIATAPTLKSLAGIESELWFPRDRNTVIPEVFHDQVDAFEEVSSAGQFRKLLNQRVTGDLPVVVISHGLWREPTRWAAHAKQLGLPWIFTPHGMLEPWSLGQKWIRKAIYFRCFEKRMIETCDVIRAVSRPEQRNLKILLKQKNVTMIPNGIDRSPVVQRKPHETVRFVFLSRLHKKKAVAELVMAFCQSPLKNNPNVELVVAGPDEGELDRITECIRTTQTDNVVVPGAIFGDKKFGLLESSDFFVLPSHSEGFPSSVVEAMGRGCIPIISDGCNFPEAKALTISASPDIDSIKNALMTAANLKPDKVSKWSSEAADFIRANYTVDKIAYQQLELLCRLTNSPLAKQPCNVESQTHVV
ncbi:glycosyltransferase [Rubripirellula reticaptiva]|uniref:UDP-D-galactose:(Glucosyl)lipopolysaccharide-1, 6-D-galactosyltransferase n=1 Tax=Rubripirellula reticaptiva TaxID=2528013 RepID=A0A5C6F7M5_9BACT|nr:glycosyltransferase [Rubripirellula reticaptiva]TWU55491.1 UDP-D-galactose:(glucosyl)lipopolysaccharide-1,6-D-galactosyltransferase [Rubripirellula reticaptiva]